MEKRLYIVDGHIGVLTNVHAYGVRIQTWATRHKLQLTATVIIVNKHFLLSILSTFNITVNPYRASLPKPQKHMWTEEFTSLLLTPLPTSESLCYTHNPIF